MMPTGAHILIIIQAAYKQQYQWATCPLMVMPGPVTACITALWVLKAIFLFFWLLPLGGAENLASSHPVSGIHSLRSWLFLFSSCLATQSSTFLVQYTVSAISTWAVPLTYSCNRKQKYQWDSLADKKDWVNNISFTYWKWAIIYH